MASPREQHNDLLEMQESQSGLYVTVSDERQARQDSGVNDTQIVIRTLGSTGTLSNSVRRSGTSGSKLQRTTSNPNSGGGSSLDHRGKKIVAMPASLYNHFRPVEDNIPIEDMSQFLYFGQKLRSSGMSKAGTSVSPSPKKLLAGLEDMLDDEMNSVDRMGVGISGKSTKMRTTSQRELTTKPACPDKQSTEIRGNSINSTSSDKGSNGNNEAAPSNLSVRVVDRGRYGTSSTTTGVGLEAGGERASTTLRPSTSTEASSTSVKPTTTTTTTTTTGAKIVEDASSKVGRGDLMEEPISSTTIETPRYTVPSRTKAVSEQQQQQSQRRAVLRNNSLQQPAEPTSGSRPSGGGTASAEPRTAAQAGGSVSSAGASVERAAARSGFTIRWTDQRQNQSKRRRIAAAARRRPGTTSNMDQEVTSPPEGPPTPTTTSTTPGATEMEGLTSSTTMGVLGKMLDPSEVQKMYRSNASSTSTTEVPLTTTGGSRSVERSPEARGRNLVEDKGKDDVLPIMQLYNTSSMFNASEVAGSVPSSSTTSVPTETVATETETSSPATSSTTTTSTRRPRPSVASTRSPGSTSTTSRPAQQVNPTIGYYPVHVNTTSGGNSSNGSGRASASGTSVQQVHHQHQNRTFFGPVPTPTPMPPPVLMQTTTLGPSGVGLEAPFVNISEVISRRHDAADVLASSTETVALLSYILASLVFFPLAIGLVLVLRRLIIRNRKVLEESDTSSEISCRKDALNLETGDFKMPIEKTITKLPRIQHLVHEVEKPPPPCSQESRWEFPRDKLRLQTVLGEGNFGQVWKAEADDLTGHQGTTRLVAVKTVKEGASDREKEDLVRELEIMQRVGSHPNVVTLLGCCTEQEPHYLILEYVMYGKLLAYLRDHRTRQDFYNFSEDSAALTSRDLTVFGYCVARGMEYLASKKIIHRDLAARNVLVDHNKLCKIADFGMSRFANEDGEVIETRHGRNALPIRWMAPESLIYSLFTTKTDVWSFGILMWEIVTLGSTPYPDMSAREVMRSVQNGYRLERPSHCRGELFRVISRCWHADPDRRPEFQLLRRELAQLLEDGMHGHYVDLESFAASECND